jgi:two-component system response regulator PilR (NtrC family)
LENIIERAMALLDSDVIDIGDLNLAPPSTLDELPIAGQISLQEHLDRVEKAAISDALHKTRFNRTAAAKLLGVTFRSLRYRMERLGLNE